MKKMAAVLTALALLFCASAFALIGTEYPVWDGSSVPADSLCGSIGGLNLQLNLDATAEYSNVSEGLAQVCFFAFDKNEQNYLEMYLLLPENAKAGDVFSATGSGISSVSLYEVSKDSDDLYFSGQISGFAYPSGSSFELRIESAQKSNNALSMQGTLEGTLVKFKGDTPVDETLELSGVKFNFTLPLNNSSAPHTDVVPEATAAPEPSVQPKQSMMPQLPAPTAMPKAPAATLDPHPAFTLPPDYAVL